MIAPTDKASKALMRAQFKAVREGLSVGERCAIDEAIARNVAALPEFAAADGVFTYLSFGAEVDTRELIQRAWEAGKTVCLPRVVPSTREMRWNLSTALCAAPSAWKNPLTTPLVKCAPPSSPVPWPSCPASPSTAKASAWATAAASTTPSYLLSPAPPSVSSAPASW